MAKDELKKVLKIALPDNFRAAYDEGRDAVAIVFYPTDGAEDIILLGCYELGEEAVRLAIMESYQYLNTLI